MNKLAQKYRICRKTVMDTSVYDIFNDFEKDLWKAMDEKKKTVGSYSTFEGSPMSEGILR